MKCVPLEPLHGRSYILASILDTMPIFSGKFGNTLKHILWKFGVSIYYTNGDIEVLLGVFWKIKLYMVETLNFTPDECRASKHY